MDFECIEFIRMRVEQLIFASENLEKYNDKLRYLSENKERKLIKKKTILNDCDFVVQPAISFLF